MRNTMWLLSVSAAAICASPAMAETDQAANAELEALRARVAALETMVERLVAGQSEVAGQAAAANATAHAAQASATQTAERVASVPEITFGAAPEVANEDGWSFKPFGRIQYDAAYVDAPDAIVDPGLGFSNELRRGRVGVEGDIPGGFGYKLEVDFANSDVEITDAIVTYDAGVLNFVVGQHNEFQSLEELTSTRFVSFMERAAFTDAFNFERRVGVSAGYAKGDFRINGGVFTDNIADLSSDEDNSYSFDGRATFSPRVGDIQLHLGGSAHWRDLQDTATAGTRYRQRPFVHTSDTRFIDTGTLPVVEETSYGFEAALIAGRIHAVAEGYWLNAGLAGLPDPSFFGGYAETGIFLTDDSRGYSGGRFNRTTPNHPVDEGGLGALQFNVRYDYLDLTDAGVIGGTQNLYAASLIWTPIAHARLSLNYGHASYDDAVIPAGLDTDYGVDVFGMRAEADF